MAQHLAEKFLKDSAAKSLDSQQQRILKDNIDRYEHVFTIAKNKFHDLSNTKKKANFLKWKVIENLDRYLVEFESNFIKRGGKVIWANDAAEAREEIWKIVERQGASTVIKSKSAVAEEIGIYSFLKDQGVETIESDIGDYIVDLAGQKPAHFVTSAIHLGQDDIARLFHDKFGTSPDASTTECIAKAQEDLRQKYTAADISITGANFLVADTGSIAITENEGNVRLTTTFPKIHIAIVGIEKVISSLNDLDLFWPLLASHGTGQNLTAYNSIISGPRQAHETDGPEEMYVILIDNGRTNLLAQKEQRQGLYCIRCGACVNACPIYKQIGGHTYNTTYPGPIGSLITPHLNGLRKYKHLSYASTLSGKSAEVCPVGIDIEKMLLLNRRDAVQKDLTSASERRRWKVFAYLVGKRKWLDLFGGKSKNFLTRLLFRKAWGPQRDLPHFAEESFSKQWEKNQSTKIR
ncbi:lactate utilization protein [Sphingobacterium sp. SGG-5]|uniref:lactate utilization protein B n=1 Tax=Sphingobacterium sp. SGG-5 TaxID=2710881 RepID=UPI0013EDDFBD|nr:lactate utilization protein B [Sphingobacterium sp. SGG-5]NGM60365.1 lactate utilization protein [Sphingobacterium sp. SGG-5]